VNLVVLPWCSRPGRFRYSPKTSQYPFLSRAIIIDFMDPLHFVNERLKFTRYFYESTVAVFEETKRKIEAKEPPYADTRDPEYGADEPAFLGEWEDADVAVDVVGATCLGLIQAADSGAPVADSAGAALNHRLWVSVPGFGLTKAGRS